MTSEQIKEFNKARHNPKFLCNAPFTAMNISYYGWASPCCSNTLVDDYKNASIKEIWEGKTYKQYRKEIRNGNLPESCSECINCLKNREYESVRIRIFDNLKASRIFPNKLRKVEVALSNTCNLECIMCNGFASSSIRKNRDKMEPIPMDYMYKFRDEIRSFIPGLQEITFLGGEPFLNPIHYDIWEDIIKINPKCQIFAVTNGTIFNDRIKSIIERGNFKISLSFDAMTKETYESIRVNAKYEETMANMKKFNDALAKQDKNKHLNILICPLQINRFEIPDLVRFCNDNSYSICFPPRISGAVDVAMHSMSSLELKETKDFYLNQKFSGQDYITQMNIKYFKELISRLDRWIELAIRKENFKNVFDLKTDKIEDIKKQLEENTKKALQEIKIDNDSIDRILHQYKNMYKQVISELPEYFYSNHFFQKLLEMQKSTNINMQSINIAQNSSITFLKKRFIDLFFYS